MSDFCAFWVFLFVPVLRKEKAEPQKYLIKPVYFHTFARCEGSRFRKKFVLRGRVFRLGGDVRSDVDFSLIFINFNIIFSFFLIFIYVFFDAFLDGVLASIFHAFWLHFSLPGALPAWIGESSVIFLDSKCLLMYV